MMYLFQTKRTAVSLAGVILAGFIMASCGSGNSTSTSTAPAAAPPPAGTNVQVSVSANDPDNNAVTPDRDTLHYRWAATEGTIDNVDQPTTTWVVPPGSGLQFAYVVVSDDKGGYTESRAAVLTSSQNQPGTVAAANIPTASSVGNPGFVWGSVFYNGSSSFAQNVYLPGVKVRLFFGGTEVAAETTTDMKGEFFISNVPNGTYDVHYLLPGLGAVRAVLSTDPKFSQSATVNGTNFPTSPSADAYIRGSVLDPAGTVNIAGSVQLADKSYCGFRNEFFTTNTNDPKLFTGPVSATAQLIDTTNTPFGNSFPVNHYGDFLIITPVSLNSAKVRISCQNAPVKDSTTAISLNVAGPKKVPNGILTLSNSRPFISRMTVLLSGQDIGRPDLPKPKTLLPEMANAPGDDAFLTYKGIDTRKSACAYYKAIGAVQDCGPDGFPTGAQLTLSQWRSKFNLSPFSNGTPGNPPTISEVNARYINSNDLAMGRDMQGIKLQDGSLAYNVCNFPGPQSTTGLGEPVDIGSETPPNTDLAIENMRRGIGMIACVAMDYSPISGITKFYTFGPSGKLLLSISLDGRREKFMPGACVACHGGDKYGGRYPDDGSGSANIGSFFLPFNVPNFAFSTAPGLTRTDVLPALKTLNQLMTQVSNPTNRATTKETDALIARWYPSNSAEPDLTPPPIYDPAKGVQATSSCTSCHSSHNAVTMYQQVVAPICRTCHITNSFTTPTQVTTEPFLSLPPITPPLLSFDNRITFELRPPSHYDNAAVICGGNSDLKLNHTMPNTLVAFERFWLSAANIPAGTPNLPGSLAEFSGACPDPLAPSPHPGL